MGKFSRSKGKRIELEIVHLHDDIPCPAEKTSRAGYTGEDIVIADHWKAEVKARANGFALLKRWLGLNDLLFLREDGVKEPTVVMPWRVYSELIESWLSDTHDRTIPR